MELFQELFLTAFIALLFSFVIAKFVSMATSGDSVSLSGSKSGFDVDQETIEEELQFRERLQVQAFQSQIKVDSLQETAEKVVEFEAENSPDHKTMKSAIGTQEIGTESCNQIPEKSQVGMSFDDSVEEKHIEREERIESVPEFRVKPDKVVEIEELATRSQEIETESRQLPEKSELRVETDDILEDKAESGQVEEIAEELKKQSDDVTQSNEISILENQLERSDDEATQTKLESDDDDWEGIERSELEKIFARAAKFVEDNGDLGGTGSDVQMELYGFHKVATEGPCREPKPMALNVSARTKWNAWQRLGNMNPEVAMEQYISLLSDKAPGWMDGHFAGEHKLESAEAGPPCALAHDISSSPDYQTNFTQESNSDLKSAMVESGDVSGFASFDDQARE